MNRTRTSFGLVAVVIAAVVAIVVATSGGAAKTGRPAVAPASSISVKQTPLGRTLVDANGRALYLFQADKRDQSTLSAAGQAIWPPLRTATKPAAGGGVTASHITLIKGASGSSQVAYNGHPLYYYVGDHTPGQTTGQGLNQFGALWYVLSPAGQAITTAPATPAPSTSSGNGYGSSTSSGNGYGY
jgi:predicted lipoprotein with Yx(FWY)xxD motif